MLSIEMEWRSQRLLLLYVSIHCLVGINDEAMSNTTVTRLHCLYPLASLKDGMALQFPTHWDVTVKSLNSIRPWPTAQMIQYSRVRFTLQCSSASATHWIAVYFSCLRASPYKCKPRSLDQCTLLGTLFSALKQSHFEWRKYNPFPPAGWDFTLPAIPPLLPATLSQRG